MSAFKRAICAMGFLGAVAGGTLPATAEESYSSNQPFAMTSFAEPSTGSDSPFQLVSNTELLDGDGSNAACCDFESCCEPAWGASLGAMFLHRSRPSPAKIMTPPTGTPGVLLSGSDFKFGWDAGPELIVTHRAANDLIWEARYFNDRSANAAFTIPAVTTFRVAGIGVTILGGGSINSSYHTQLDSSEFNLHKAYNESCSFLAGFRIVELHDNLRANIATPTTFVAWDENNHLFGGQIGIDKKFLSPGSPWQFDGILKAGVYSNVADNTFTSNIVGSNGSSSTSAAFVGELNFTGSYQITQHLSLKGGYTVLWLEGLALASRAAADTVQIAGGTSSPINNHGGLWYNGATTALEYVW